MNDIALATRDDLPALYNMICALSAFHGDESQVTLDHLDDIFFGPAPMGIALIAKQGGSPVGYAGLTPTMVLHEGKIRLDIHHLFVVETHRSAGVGTALILAAKSHAKKIGATRLTIGTDPSNKTAIAAYRAMDILKDITGAGPRFSVDLTT
ncbi:GNAT family N-acetyltransferase [Octadecabacter sp. 1_MG-2023]|uniref:GNAT family N-acetyltransferase n=1 Tax=unclassified Octadecabacter TaxID=196158 RepID=UPI001C087B2C|nr:MULTISPECIES: GNAT family N-acetyltransferase [unclassified Octadecabacter]MBU2992680.1 GNAT family N-acetyltransferase [Octadecabacter sp. B2R22]MDO6733869.1 GNAT family N-acetyltransferase [Octadecabacter sp. 1_MG-2023]